MENNGNFNRNYYQEATGKPFPEVYPYRECHPPFENVRKIPSYARERLSEGILDPK
jgi:hypothetical protein